MWSLLGSQKIIPQSKNFEREMFELFIAIIDTQILAEKQFDYKMLILTTN